MGHDDDNLLRPAVEVGHAVPRPRQDSRTRVGVATAGRGGLVRIDQVEMREVYARVLLDQIRDRAAYIARLVRVLLPRRQRGYGECGLRG